ncbi:MAG: T9SS type A sorting domain-containing protein [Calditrichaceae bacterium]|nr:T9SS type A sorting domain-containing protein [Calditrichia bacterium]NUQ42460.1 T9SS type A sorting domain-containing protein [Calditrichaceae bacterium]
MKSFLHNKQFLFPAKLMAGASITGNPAGIKKGIILSFLFFFLLVSAIYGQGGVVHTRSFVHDGVLRQYLLYVPAAYNTSEGDWPLVINYHGFTSSAALQMSVHSKMNFIADTAHFLVAYPQGLVVQDLVSGVSGTGWNIPGLYNASHDDVAFTDSLIDHVDADFRVELERVHTTGWSNGSEMVFYLACKLPDRIASVAGVSGLMSYNLLDSCDVERPFSTLLMHGTADPIYPFTGFPNFTPSAPTIPLFWASHNNCLDSIVTELPDINTADNCTVTLIEYVDCDSAEVLFYRINNGGHAWPGGPYIPGILGNTNYDINGSSEIWNFFTRNPMPDTTITSIADHADHLTKTFRLYQNYPNPFNPVTTIKYSLLKPSQVELKIYNALGQLVKTLADGYQTTGEYSAVWDGKDGDGNLLSSGIYFYRIQMGEFSAVRKMAYLK